jgi:hypothetical protein
MIVWTPARYRYGSLGNQRTARLKTQAQACGHLEEIQAEERLRGWTYRRWQERVLPVIFAVFSGDLGLPCRGIRCVIMLAMRWGYAAGASGRHRCRD